MKKKKGKVSRVLEEVADVFAIPGEAVAGVPRVTVTGKRKAYVENHRGLLEYGDREISVNGGLIIIRFRGENLELGAMREGELVITGTIMSVEFLP